MTLKSYSATFIALFLAAVAIRASAADPPAIEKKPPAATDKKTPAPNRVLVTISKETTVLTKPLRKDGYVDYVAALNEIYGKGVTPENNAVVPFWNAVGAASISPKIRAEYFRMLGVPVPAATGNYFIELDAFVRKQNPAQRPEDSGGVEAIVDKCESQLDVATGRPWSSKKFPELADWLAKSQGPLDAIVESSHRSRCFSPMVGGDRTPVIGVLCPYPIVQRGAAKALAARALLRLEERKTDATWQDLLAVHRLARLCGQGPTLIDALVAISIDGIACRGDQAVLRNAGLSGADALRMRDDLAKLSPLPSMAEKIDRAERFTFLDCAAIVSRDGPLALLKQLQGGNPRQDVAEKVVDSMARYTIDWDLVLRMGNSWYDRAVAALRKTTIAEQNAALKQFDRDARAIGKRPENWIPSALANLRGTISERLGNTLVAMLLPHVAAARAERRATMKFSLTKLGFSIAAYRADHGSYPAKLDELVPKYATEIPKDVFTAGVLHYKPAGDGYVLYSVGPNEKDDGGMGREDDKQFEHDWDDIVVRVPRSR